jgi:hypothetical protein
MDLLDELNAEIRPIARRVSLSANRYSAMCIALLLLLESIRHNAQDKADALADVAAVLDGYMPSEKSGLRAVIKTR